MIARQLALVCLAVAVGIAALRDAGSKDLPPGAMQLRGAGSTFAAPLQKKWLEAYQKRHPEVVINYEAIGSGEGTRQFLAGAVDFGASDAALSDEQMAAVPPGAQLVPIMAGSIVLAYNLDGLGGPLKLSRAVYADIFFGKITSWNDPRIQQLNPDLKLPRQDIVLVVRQDGSGTTYAFTNHLSAMSQEWRERGPGVGALVAWPGHPMTVPGNEGVAGRIKQSKGAIGYVEYGIAQRGELAMAWLENKAGAFIQPHGGSGLATLLNVPMPDNLRVFAPDPDGEDSYPIVTYSWLLLYKTYDNPQKSAALKDYVRWCVTDGQAFNESLGFVRLPPQVVSRALRAVDSVR
jgi:phosphate transport system substrate-binding protein